MNHTLFNSFQALCNLHVNERVVLCGTAQRLQTVQQQQNAVLEANILTQRSHCGIKYRYATTTNCSKRPQ